MDADADPTNVSDLTSLNTDTEYQNQYQSAGENVTGKAENSNLKDRDDSPLTELEDEELSINDSEAESRLEDDGATDMVSRGPFTPTRRNYVVQGPASVNGSSPSRIGIAIARPMKNNAIRTYGKRRKELHASSRPPETPKQSTSQSIPAAQPQLHTPAHRNKDAGSESDSGMHADTDADGHAFTRAVSPLSPLTPQTPLTSPRKRRMAADSRRVSAPTRRKKGRIATDGDGVDSGKDDTNGVGPIKPLSSASASTPSGRRAKRIAGAVENSPLALGRGDVSIKSNARARRSESPVKRAEYGEGSISVRAPTNKGRPRPRKGTNAKDRAVLFAKLKKGTLVWVRIDALNNPTEDLLETAYWWPGKIVTVDESVNSVKVDVYYPPAHNLPLLRVKITSPSRYIILPKKDAKITITNCSISPPDDPREAPNQSNVDTQIKSRWAYAFLQVEKEDHMGDESPSPSKGREVEISASASAGRSRSNTIGSKGTKRKRADNNPVSVQNGDPWSPPPPDEAVEVPGEYILAKEKKSKTLFYPAKVIAYEAPENAKAPPLYAVKFMDNVLGHIPRECFYIYEQEEFGTCKLGQYQSVESRYEDDTVEDTKFEISAMSTVGFTIPDPKLPPPSQSEFCDLPILEQVSYITPVLRSVLEDRYTPAKVFNNEFLKGGRRREALVKEAPAKGVLTRQEYEEIGRIVASWAYGLSSEPQSSNASFGINDLRRSNSDALPHPPMPHLDQEAPSRPDSASENTNSVVTESKPEVTTLPKHTDVLSPLSSQAPSDLSDNLKTPTLPPSSLPELASLSPAADHGSCGVSELTCESNGNSIPISGLPIPQILRSLSDREKINYCTDILLREAVIQLLLWREGLRSVPDLLDAKEEERLRKIGLSLANTFDIAHHVMELRDKKEKTIQLQISSTPLSVTGTRSRPKYV